jgi:hypothetical protein
MQPGLRNDGLMGGNRERSPSTRGRYPTSYKKVNTLPKVGIPI